MLFNLMGIQILSLSGISQEKYFPWNSQKLHRKANFSGSQFQFLGPLLFELIQEKTKIC